MPYCIIKQHENIHYSIRLNNMKIYTVKKKARGVLGLRGVTAQGVLWQHTRVLR